MIMYRSMQLRFKNIYVHIGASIFLSRTYLQKALLDTIP